jgi:hypothetical protein
MSKTKTWNRRLQNHSYSLDDRNLSYNFSKNLEKDILKFLDNHEAHTMLIGEFNIEKEPWRMLAINDYKKFGVKILEKPINDKLTEIHLIKKSLSQHMAGY